jgi:hypothetical protein
MVPGQPERSRSYSTRPSRQFSPENPDHQEFQSIPITDKIPQGGVVDGLRMAREWVFASFALIYFLRLSAAGCAGR